MAHFNDAPQVWEPTSSQQETLAEDQAQVDFIHNFSDLSWECDSPPQPTQTKQLYHLLTIMGQLLIGYWPTDSELGEHYVSWAPLSSAPITYQ